MKDHLQRLVDAADNPLEGRNVAREYLQARILAALQRTGAMTTLAFHGGTALRVLYSIPRYSEDLDFALERPTLHYDFRSYIRVVAADLKRDGYAVECKVSTKRTVHSAFVRFRGLLFELALSHRREEILAVKVEVDTKPPAGARLETTVVRRHLLLHLQHHDRASLLAGKTHAILQRPYLKGRDVFDLIWYLADPTWPDPNLLLLNSALQQTGGSRLALDALSWREAVRKRLANADWRKIRSDVRPFLKFDGGGVPLEAEVLDQLLTSRRER